jgi:RND superfamily putative drug exporter
LKHVEGSPAVAVTGDAAVNIDISQKLLDALPLYLAIIVVFVLLLMLIVFRSILIPIKAAVSFILSLGAALGATVAVFEWGWLGAAFQVDVTGPVLSFLPILVVGILFGLSMDYETFLVSGIRERIAAGDEPRAAVRNGFATNAKVIVAAGVIMLIVFVNGALKPGSAVQPIALALAVGVLLDVFLIRMTLVPAVLTIAGRWTWALPAWLDRILPHVSLEGDPESAHTGKMSFPQSVPLNEDRA